MKHQIDLKNFNIRTDLAIELTEGGITEKVGNNKITTINLDEASAKKISKKPGTYITVEFEDITDYETRGEVITILTKQIKKILKQTNIKKDDLGLIIGLGNEKSTPDSLGPLVISKIIVTNHLYLYGDLDDNYRRICALSPGVMGETGIETSDLIKGIISTVKSNFVIVIDALASSSLERVNKTVQISSSGINPGSGVGNKRKEISKDTLGIPVIAIGVPTVVDAASIVSDTIGYMYKHFAYEKENINNPKNKLMVNVNYLNKKSQINNQDKENLFGIVGTLNEEQTKSLITEVLNPTGYNFMVTPKEEDFVIEKLSDLISKSLNDAMHNIKNDI